MSFQHLEEIVRFHLPSIDRNLDIEMRRVEKNYLELYQRVDMRTPVRVEPYIRLLEQCRKI